MESIMGMIGNWIDAWYDWALKETNTVKCACKSFIAGFIDGWEFGCLIIGNMVCLGGLIAMMLAPFIKKKED